MTDSTTPTSSAEQPMPTSTKDGNEFLQRFIAFYKFLRQARVVTIAGVGFRTTGLTLEEQDKGVSALVNLTKLCNDIEAAYRGVNFAKAQIADEEKPYYIHISKMYRYYLTLLLEHLAALHRDAPEHKVQTPWVQKLLALPAFNCGYVFQSAVATHASRLENLFNQQERVASVAGEIGPLQLRISVTCRWDVESVYATASLYSPHVHGNSKEIYSAYVLPTAKPVETLQEEAVQLLLMRGALTTKVRDARELQTYDDGVFAQARAVVAERTAQSKATQAEREQVAVMVKRLRAVLNPAERKLLARHWETSALQALLLPEPL